MSWRHGGVFLVGNPSSSSSFFFFPWLRYLTQLASQPVRSREGEQTGFGAGYSLAYSLQGGGGGRTSWWSSSQFAFLTWYKLENKESSNSSNWTPFSCLSKGTPKPSPPPGPLLCSPLQASSRLPPGWALSRMKTKRSKWSSSSCVLGSSSALPRGVAKQEGWQSRWGKARGSPLSLTPG